MRSRAASRPATVASMQASPARTRRPVPRPSVARMSTFDEPPSRLRTSGPTWVSHCGSTSTCSRSRCRRLRLADTQAASHQRSRAVASSQRDCNASGRPRHARSSNSRNVACRLRRASVSSAARRRASAISSSRRVSTTAWCTRVLASALALRTMSAACVPASSRICRVRDSCSRPSRRSSAVVCASSRLSTSFISRFPARCAPSARDWQARPVRGRPG